MSLYIYITILNYITNATACFGASALSSESFDTVFAKVINFFSANNNKKYYNLIRNQLPQSFSRLGNSTLWAVTGT